MTKSDSILFSIVTLVMAFITLFVLSLFSPKSQFISPLTASFQSLHPLQSGKNSKEVFGFAPYWTMDQLDNVDFSVLTTFAYFGIPVNGDGTLDTTDQGYYIFKSQQATSLFKKAHRNGTRVVLTLTQMDNDSINGLMDDISAQKTLIRDAVALVNRRGIDGINVDFEYTGDPGQEYRDRFSAFVRNLTDAMHAANPSSKVTVSVYASAVKEPKIYDIAAISKDTDGIFMMAYDFATTSADNAIPTSPLYGYKAGKYWYDVSTAVEDFLTQMPPEKLILGVPWYGYNYLVYEPGVKAETRPYYSWRGTPVAQTYSLAKNTIDPLTAATGSFKSGWDEYGQVGWKAYYDGDSGTWRMIFLEDTVSLGKKYDFAKKMNLGGVGIWALGFDEGKSEMWQLLGAKFGSKLVDNTITNKVINDNI